MVPAAAKNPRGGLEYMRIMLSKEGAKGFTEQVSSLTVVKGAADGVKLPAGPDLRRRRRSRPPATTCSTGCATRGTATCGTPASTRRCSDLLSGRKNVDQFVEGCEAEAKKVRDDDSVTKYTR